MNLHEVRALVTGASGALRPRPGREIADAGRRREIDALIGKVQQKVARAG